MFVYKSHFKQLSLVAHKVSIVYPSIFSDAFVRRGSK